MRPNIFSYTLIRQGAMNIAYSSSSTKDPDCKYNLFVGTRVSQLHDETMSDAPHGLSDPLNGNNLRRENLEPTIWSYEYVMPPKQYIEGRNSNGKVRIMVNWWKNNFKTNIISNNRNNKNKIDKKEKRKEWCRIEDRRSLPL